MPTAFTVLASLVALAATLPAVSTAFASPWATGKDERLTWSGSAPTLAPLACDGAPVVALSAGADTTLSGDTTAAYDVNAGYSCVAWNESGGEVVFRLVVSEEIVLTAALAISGIDHDLFLLSACDGDACLAAGNTQLGLRVAPGEYFLVVDGYEGAVGPFAVLVRTLAAGVPEEVCEGSATPVECQTEPQLFEGTLWEAADAIEQYDCSPYLEQGGEAWFAVTMRDSTLISTVSAPALDTALWLFDGCGPEATCLAFADQNLAGQAETLMFDNGDAGARRTLYLAVDALRAPDTVYEAGFTLSVGCALSGAVPTESESWGALKARFR